MQLTPDQLRSIVREEVSHVIEKSSCVRNCRYDMEPEEHRKSHEAVERFIRTMENIDSIRWGVAKAVVLLLVLTAVSLMGWGIFHRLENFLK